MENGSKDCNDDKASKIADQLEVGIWVSLNSFKVDSFGWESWSVTTDSSDNQEGTNNSGSESSDKSVELVSKEPSRNGSNNCRDQVQVSLKAKDLCEHQEGENTSGGTKNWNDEFASNLVGEEGNESSNYGTDDNGSSDKSDLSIHGDEHGIDNSEETSGNHKSNYGSKDDVDEFSSI